MSRAARNNMQPVGLLVAALVLILAGVGPAAAAPTAVQRPPDLAVAGKTGYRIVVTGPVGETGVRAATELARYLKAVSGAPFPVGRDTGDNAGPVIRLQVAPGEVTSNEGFRIRTNAGGVSLVAADPRGLFHAVHYLLGGYLGVRWLDSDYTRIPDSPTLRLPAIDETRSPRFVYREVFARGADDPDFSARNRLNGRFGHRLVKAPGEHLGVFRGLDHVNVFSLVPPRKYRSDHPEYYGAGQLQYARPAVRAIAAEAVLQRLAKTSDNPPAYLLIEHADRATYFNRGRDGVLIEQHGAPSAAYLGFVRHIANAVAERYPDVRILAQAYLWSRKPPRDMSLPGNMGVMFAPIGRDHAQPLTAPANAAVLEDLKGWGRLTDHVVVWTYHTNFANYLQPYPDLHTLGPDARLLSRLDHVKGWFAQGAYNTRGGALAPLRTWVLSRLMWDPERRADELIDTFLADYYGNAAPYLGEYVNLLEAAGAGMDKPLDTKVAANASYLNAGLLREADRLFKAAEAAVDGQPEHLRHVQDARMSVDFAVLTTQPAVDAPAWVDYEDRLDRLERYMARAGMSAYREGRGHPPAELVDMLAIRRQRPPEPDVCGGRPPADCVSAQELSFDLAGGASIVRDESASDRAAARQAGDRRAWGVQLPLSRMLPSEGRWRIYLQLRVAGAGHDRVLLNGGVYPGQQRDIHSADLDAGGYTLVPLPGTWQADSGRYVWVAPAGGEPLKALYVDRVIAVRERAG